MASWSLFVMALLVTILAESVRSRDLIEGVRILGDKLAIKENIQYSRRFLRNRQETKTFNIEGYITYIRLLDNSKENGASPRIVGGGVGNSFVNIDFKSKTNHGIDFDIEIYKTDKWN